MGFDADWSLSALGNCAHKGVIRPMTIKRVVRVRNVASSTWMLAADPSISVMNYHICGDYYCTLSEWVGDGGKGPLPHMNQAMLEASDEVMFQKQLEYWNSAVERMRQDIEVVYDRDTA